MSIPHPLKPAKVIVAVHGDIIILNGVKYKVTDTGKLEIVPVDVAPENVKQVQVVHGGKGGVTASGFRYALVHPDAKAPVHVHEGDAGWDLVTCESRVVPAGGYSEIPTGVCVEMPIGVWGRLTGRSSTAKHLHLQLQEGIIDNGYTGELWFGAWNHTESPITVPAGSRIGQLIFHPLICTSGEEVFKDFLVSRDGRGANGFGSTGK